MVTLGVDAHKRSHTIVAADEHGRQVGQLTVAATSPGHLKALRWAAQWPEQVWAVEDCRHLSRRLEAELLAAGQQVVRVQPKLMAGARRGARTRGKSDPIDALAVARAALREPGLPVARLDGPERVVRLLTDHRDDLVAERTRVQQRLRWHLHELDPGWEVPARGLDRGRVLDQVQTGLAGRDGVVAELARELVDGCRALTVRINELERRIGRLVARLAPSLLALEGCAGLTAAKLVGETAGITRFRSRAAYAMHSGTAPVPVWSGNRQRHRLNRAATGSSTSRCTASRSPRCAGRVAAGTRMCSTAWLLVIPRPRLSVRCAGGSPTRSTGDSPLTTTNNQPLSSSRKPPAA
jgi:transposase